MCIIYILKKIIITNNVFLVIVLLIYEIISEISNKIFRSLAKVVSAIIFWWVAKG